MRKGQLKNQPARFPAGDKNHHQKEKPGRGTAFSFGDPERVLASNLVDYLGIFINPHGDYYEPPVSQSGLAKLLRANGYHGTIPYFRRNMLRRWYIDNDALPAEDLKKAGFDHDVFGNCYFQIVENRFRKKWWLRHLPALNMRRMKTADQFCMLRSGRDPLPFKPGEVVQLKEYDPVQQIYGVPQYLGGIQSVLLSEDATLFRRRYYQNGAHMGYVFYTADANLDPDDETALKEQIRNSKGVGNFRSMFLNVPGGKPDSVKIIPVGDIATKDEFERVKNLTRNDVLAMWRINGALAGVLPENNAGFGDLDKISRNNYENEVVPVQQVFLQLNNILHPSRKIGFATPSFASEA